MAALGSTTLSFCSFAVTWRLSRPMTATCEKVAPVGFQHFVQPQTWLYAVSPFKLTVTGEVAHLQVSVPPAKLATPGFTPPSTAGCIEIAMMFSFQRLRMRLLDPSSECHDRADRLALVHQVERVVDLLNGHHVRDE